jgi:hypothetical protein
MGADLRERESGGTERGAAPVPPTRGGGTVQRPCPLLPPRNSAGARHGGTRGRPERGNQRGVRGNTGEHKRGAGPAWPAGDAATSDRRFTCVRAPSPPTLPWSSRDSAEWTSSRERSGWNACQSRAATRTMPTSAAAVSGVSISSLSSPFATPVAQDVLDDRDGLLTDHHQRGLPGPVGAPQLRHVQLREGRVAVDEDEARPDHRVQGVDLAAAVPGGPLRRLPEGGGEESHSVPQQLLEEDGLAREVVVDGALGHSGALGDLVHRRGREALFGDERDGRLVELLPGGLSARAAAAVHRPAAFHGPDCHRLSSGCSRSRVHTCRRRADSAVSARAPAVKAARTAHACQTGPRPPPVMSLRGPRRRNSSA